MRDFLIAYQSWISIAVFAVLCAGINWATSRTFDRILMPRGVRLRWRIAAALVATSMVAGGMLLAFESYAAPYFREECCRARLSAWLERSPYATLVEHHPEAKTALINAFLKIGKGGTDAVVGHAEMRGVLNRYLRKYLPMTSDRAAREFATAAARLVDTAASTEPQFCVAFQKDLTGPAPTLALTRYGNAIGTVITDGIRNPQPIPDAYLIHSQRQKVAERMKRDGNPLATDPNYLRSDPNRDCLALAAMMPAASAAIPDKDLGTFLRGTIADYLQEIGA